MASLEGNRYENKHGGGRVLVIEDPLQWEDETPPMAGDPADLVKVRHTSRSADPNANESILRRADLTDDDGVWEPVN